MGGDFLISCDSCLVGIGEGRSLQFWCFLLGTLT